MFILLLSVLSTAELWVLILAGESMLCARMHALHMGGQGTILGNSVADCGSQTKKTNKHKQNPAFSTAGTQESEAGTPYIPRGKPK